MPPKRIRRKAEKDEVAPSVPKRMRIDGQHDGRREAEEVNPEAVDSSARESDNETALDDALEEAILNILGSRQPGKTC